MLHRSSAAVGPRLPPRGARHGGAPPRHGARAAPPRAQRQTEAASPGEPEPNGSPRVLTLARFGSARQLAAPPAGASAAAAADGASAPGADAVLAPGGAAAGAWWDALPSRYQVLFGGFMSFVICNMVRR
jgi:hypothetical protein